MEYGEVLDDYIGSENIYQLFSKYFNNPLMTKIKNVDSDYCIYAVKLYCLLSKECRYIITCCKYDILPIGSKKHLEQMEWVSLQTRTLKDHYNVDTHSYIPKLEGLLNKTIHRVETSAKTSTYHCDDYPVLIITLVHTPKKGATSYQDKGNIIAALETWETIITFK